MNAYSEQSAVLISVIRKAEILQHRIIYDFENGAGW